jgi:HK97 family phage prohead protease
MVDGKGGAFLMFETKILTIVDAKLSGDGPGRFSGYASTFGNIDSYGDTVVKGAYASTIPDFLRDGFIPWGHDWSGYPVATPDKAHEDNTGLWIEAVFHTDPESQRARQIVAERLDRGKTMGLSIGYETKGWDIAEMDGQQVRRLLDIRLLEVSIVPVPADASAMVSAVKAKRRLSRHQLEAVIATLQALMGDDDEEAVAEALAADPIEDGKAADPPAPLTLDLAGAKLLDDLGAYVARLKATPADETVAARAQIAGLLRQLSSARLDLDVVMTRADVLGQTAPRELFDQFRRLDGLYGPISSRQAG